MKKIITTAKTFKSVFSKTTGLGTITTNDGKIDKRFGI